MINIKRKLVLKNYSKNSSNKYLKLSLKLIKLLIIQKKYIQEELRNRNIQTVYGHDTKSLIIYHCSIFSNSRVNFNIYFQAKCDGFRGKSERSYA